MSQNNTLHVPDAETVKLCRDITQGDFSYFWQFWLKNKNLLLKICMKHSWGGENEAEEALSGVMVKVVEILPKHINSIKNIKSWLVRITNNYCIDLYRERQRVKAVFKNLEDVAQNGEELIYIATDIDEHYLSANSDIAKDIISRIPEILREPFINRCYYEMPYSEIAGLLNVSIPAARKRVQRARELIQKLINEKQIDRADIINNAFAISSSVPEFKNHIAGIDLNAEENKVANELEFNSSILHNAQVILESGVVLDTYIGLKNKPGRQELKENTLKGYIERFPKGWKKRLELANLLYSANRWQEASEMYQEVLKRNENLVNVRIGLGEMYQLMENDDKSVKIYESAIPFARNTGTIHHVKGLIEMQKKNYNLAIMEFKKSIIEEAGHEAHRQKLGMTYYALDQSEDALSCFNKVLEINPKNIIALTHSAEILIKTGRPVQGICRAEKILVHDKTNIPALKMVTDDRCRRRLVFNDDDKKTRRLIKKMEKLGPEIADVCDSLAFYQIVRGKIDKGLGLLADFTEKHQNNPRGWFHHGKWLYRTGKTELAAESIQKAWSLYKNDPNINKLACKILSHVKLPKILIKVIDDMLYRFDRRWSVWAAAAHAMANIAKGENKAHDYSSRAIELQPDLPENMFQAGFVFDRIHNTKYAIKSLEKGFCILDEERASPIAARAAIRLALYYRENAEMDIHDEYLKKAESMIHPIQNINPSYGFYLLGMLREAQDDRAGSIEAYSKAGACNLFYPARLKADNAKKRLGLGKN